MCLARKAAYSKLGRAIKKDTVPPEVLKRYGMDQGNERKKFVFLLEFLMAFRPKSPTKPIRYSIPI